MAQNSKQEEVDKILAQYFTQKFFLTVIIDHWIKIN